MAPTTQDVFFTLLSLLAFAYLLLRQITSRDRELRNDTEHQYSPIPDGWIRLIQLTPDHGDKQAPVRCRLVDYCLSDTEQGTHPYEALSYVWGVQGPDGPKEDLHCQNGYLHIMRNLEAALKRLRYRSVDRLLWVDSVCINQMDVDERASQVLMMAKIYAHASRVLVWLEETSSDGASTTDSGRGLEELRVLGGRRFESRVEGNNTSDDGRQAIRSLLSRSWFQRIWVGLKMGLLGLLDIVSLTCGFDM